MATSIPRSADEFLINGLETQECPICYVAYGERDGASSPEHAVAIKTCGHIFGHACLSKHVTGGFPSSHLCPVCRNVLFQFSAQEKAAASRQGLLDRLAQARARDPGMASEPPFLHDAQLQALIRRHTTLATHESSVVPQTRARRGAFDAAPWTDELLRFGHASSNAFNQYNGLHAPEMHSFDDTLSNRPWTRTRSSSATTTFQPPEIPPSPQGASHAPVDSGRLLLESDNRGREHAPIAASGTIGDDDAQTLGPNTTSRSCSTHVRPQGARFFASNSTIFTEPPSTPQPALGIFPNFTAYTSLTEQPRTSPFFRGRSRPQSSNTTAEPVVNPFASAQRNAPGGQWLETFTGFRQHLRCLNCGVQGDHASGACPARGD